MTLIDLVRSNPGRSFNLPTLCAQFRISREKLHYGFKRMFGISAHDFQTEVRMQQAATRNEMDGIE